jgi:glycosyltransferase involved in cell wall biosynthesis
MRVLIISHGHPSYSIGGAEVASHALFRAIEATPEHEAFYLARAPATIRRHAATPLMSLRHGAREAFLHTGVWDEFWLSNGGTTELCGAFASYMQRIDPDVVHFHHVIGLGLEAVALVRRLLPRARLVITFHEYLAICANHGQMVKTGRHALCMGASPALCNVCLPQHGPADFFAREQHIRAHLLLVDMYISPSRFLVDRYVAWGLPQERFRVIENAVDGEPVPARVLSASTRRARFGFFGQVTEFKGLAVLLDATSRVPEELWGDATLSVFGGNLEFQPEAFQRRFHTLVEAAGNRVKFHGSYRQDELPGLMSEIDWVIVPSIWWENSPVVIQEAFLHRRPVIASGIGGMAEKIRNGIDGLHFRAGSPESLAEKLGRALTEDGLWEQLSAAAPRPSNLATFAAEHFALYQDIPDRLESTVGSRQSLCVAA